MHTLGSRNPTLWIARVANHVKRNLLLYTLLSVASSITLNSLIPVIPSMPKPLYSKLVMVLAVLTILPSMVILRGEELHRHIRLWKEITLASICVYVISPLIALAFSRAIPAKGIALGYYLSNLVPASSASLGYVMMASGSVELATVLLILLSMLALLTIPALLMLYSSIQFISLPTTKIISSLVTVLIIPMAVGQAVRFFIARRRGAEFIEKELRPGLNLVTMLSMLSLVFVLIGRSVNVLKIRPWISLEIISLQIVAMLILIAPLLIIDKAMKVGYGNHQALTFISITKNQGIAAAIAASGLGGGALLAPALVPTIQPIIAIVYLHLSDFVRKLLKT